MSNVALYTVAGDRSGSMALPEGLLAERVHTHAIWEAVKGHLANQRQGTHKTKTRHEVSGQKSKMYKQKGTGRARAGSATSGTRVGGGRIHGPRPRDYSYRVPAQVRQLALRSALTSRANKESLFVVENLALEAPKTKTVAALLGKMGVADRKVLFISGRPNENLALSVRNLPNARVTHAGELNAYQVMQAHTVVLTRDGLEALQEVLAS
jgi:large subunit ribosomal protein L4